MALESPDDAGFMEELVLAFFAYGVIEDAGGRQEFGILVFEELIPSAVRTCLPVSHFPEKFLRLVFNNVEKAISVHSSGHNIRVIANPRLRVLDLEPMFSYFFDHAFLNHLLFQVRHESLFEFSDGAIGTFPKLFIFPDLGH